MYHELPVCQLFLLYSKRVIDYYSGIGIMWKIADVAQLVEQDFRKVKVGGSIPLIGLYLNYGFA